MAQPNLVYDDDKLTIEVDVRDYKYEHPHKKCSTLIWQNVSLQTGGS